MKILILGATGMLGHKLYQVLSQKSDVIGTIRTPFSRLDKFGIFRRESIIPNIDALEISQVRKTIEEVKPDVIINCIGIIKQAKEAKDRLLSIWINSLLPHQLYRICSVNSMRFIHISTDCVFSGRKGNYREDDPSDAEDIYGKTKYLGEVIGENSLTIRTSIIGRELESRHGLVEWFLTNRGDKVKGFSRAIFSGFPTLYIANIIADIVMNHQNLEGIYHISSNPINKFDLLTLINRKMSLGIEIEKSVDFHCDRSLNSVLYHDETGFSPPSWEEMINEFTEDAMQYRRWRE